MYCYIMDVPIASVGINGVAPYTFVSTTLKRLSCTGLSPILPTSIIAGLADTKPDTCLPSKTFHNNSTRLVLPALVFVLLAPMVCAIYGYESCYASTLVLDFVLIKLDTISIIDAGNPNGEWKPENRY